MVFLLKEWIQVGFVFFVRGGQMWTRTLPLRPRLSLQSLLVVPWVLIFVYVWSVTLPHGDSSTKPAFI